MIKPRYIILFIIIGLLFIFGEIFSMHKLKLASDVSEVINFFTPAEELKSRIAELELENKDLKNQIFNQSIGAPDTYKVYSSYPFNNTNEIAIAAGSKDGIQKGDTVVSGETLLVGRIEKVFKNYSIATTIHNPDWEMEVRIGSEEINAIFKGGNRLSVDLIPEDKLIQEGDMIISAGVGFPYGLSVGNIENLSKNTNGQFLRASVEPVVSINKLKDVSIRPK